MNSNFDITRTPHHNGKAREAAAFTWMCLIVVVVTSGLPIGLGLIIAATILGGGGVSGALSTALFGAGVAVLIIFLALLWTSMG